MRSAAFFSRVFHTLRHFRYAAVAIIRHYRAAACRHARYA